MPNPNGTPTLLETLQGIKAGQQSPAGNPMPPAPAGAPLGPALNPPVGLQQPSRGPAAQPSPAIEESAKKFFDLMKKGK